jgi:hypothetical protein
MPESEARTRRAVDAASSVKARRRLAGSGLRYRLIFCAAGQRSTVASCARNATRAGRGRKDRRSCPDMGWDWWSVVDVGGGLWTSGGLATAWDEPSNARRTIAVVGVLGRGVSGGRALR